MKKSFLLFGLSILLASCSGTTPKEPDNPEPEPKPTVVTDQDILKNFFASAKEAYSIQSKVTDYSSYYGVVSTAQNYLDIAGNATNFSITSYKQVFDNYGSINRNDIDSDIRYLKYSYEDRDDVVASSYLDLSNNICYNVPKDDYGYKTYWGDSFELFFNTLSTYAVNECFTTEDNKVYSFDFTKVEEEDTTLNDQILYQTGYLSPSGITSLEVRELKFTIADGSVTDISIRLIDDQDESIYQSILIEGTIKSGDDASSDVKVEEKSNGDELTTLKAAFDSLKAYNFEFELKVIISTLEQEEYHTTAKADGKKIVSDKFAYVEGTEGLEYYVSPADDGSIYKTMQTVSDGKLSDILPSFDISTFFFTQASKTTYTVAKKAKRVSFSSNDFSCYAPFILSFSSTTVKVTDDSISIVGKSESYEFDITYTNIGKVKTIDFTAPSSFGYGDYLSDYSWNETYQQYISAYKSEFGLEEDDDLYTLLNNVPTYKSYNMSSTGLAGMTSESTTLYGIINKYFSTYKREADYTNISKFYIENGYTLKSTLEDGTMQFTKAIVFQDKSYTMNLMLFEQSSYEIPCICIFPLISQA